jgi:hypothetical protein
LLSFWTGLRKIKPFTGCGVPVRKGPLVQANRLSEGNTSLPWIATGDFCRSP